MVSSTIIQREAKNPAKSEVLSVPASQLRKVEEGLSPASTNNIIA
jgi:hypothetical protein